MNHPAAATTFQRDPARAKWHDQSLWFVREKRDRASKDVPEWEALRQAASDIKEHTMSRLADYLVEFETQANKRGIHVHWALDAHEHNDIVAGILQKNKARRIVKSKSMLTEECHLNPHLEALGMEVIDTDLGERIVQMRNEPPSHIVLPAIHLKKEDISDLFHEQLHTEAGNSDPKYLTEAARQHLREKFMAADAGITGANFAVAETGGIVVCTNEGNADLGTTLPKVHIVCMGLEKLIPRLEHLPVFLRLLARSATGQSITTYTTHFHGPQPGGQMHVVILDNQRSQILGREKFAKSLGCIRCGACLNTCPVYRRSGGHSYGHVIPGPIGSVLAPHHDKTQHASLPFASSLCGSCTDVCPVKIDLHHQLLAWREELSKSGHADPLKSFMLKFVAKVFLRPALYHTSFAILRKLLRWSPRFLLVHRFNPWSRQRELPEPARESFSEAYARRGKKNG